MGLQVTEKRSEGREGGVEWEGECRAVELIGSTERDGKMDLTE